MKKILLIIALSCVIGPPVYADTIILKNGRRIEGAVIQDDEYRVKFEEYIGAGVITTEYSRDEIDEIIKDEKVTQEIVQEHKVKSKKERRNDADFSWREHTATGIEYGGRDGDHIAFEISKSWAEQLNSEQISFALVGSAAIVFPKHGSKYILPWAKVHVVDAECKKMISNPSIRKKNLEEWHRLFILSEDEQGEKVEGGNGVLVIYCNRRITATIEGDVQQQQIKWNL